MQAPPLPTTSSLDPNALGALRGQARANDPKAVEAAARQFESLFLNQLLKSMREAQRGDGDGLFDSNESRMYTGLLDEQLANRLANGRGIGLADMVIAQIERARAAVTPGADAVGDPIRHAGDAIGQPAAGTAVKNGPAAPLTQPGVRHGG